MDIWIASFSVKLHGAWDAIHLHPKGAINMEAVIREIRILNLPELQECL